MAVLIEVEANAVFQYRERSWEDCNTAEKNKTDIACFNTENGRGRTAILCP